MIFRKIYFDSRSMVMVWLREFVLRSFLSIFTTTRIQNRKNMHHHRDTGYGLRILVCRKKIWHFPHVKRWAHARVNCENLVSFENFARSPARLGPFTKADYKLCIVFYGYLFTFVCSIVDQKTAKNCYTCFAVCNNKYNIGTYLLMWVGTLDNCRYLTTTI